MRLKTILLLFVALTYATPAFARIGETVEQLDKRYGRPLETSRDKGETRRYSFRGFTVLVGLDRGISQCEVYRKADNSRMSEPELFLLLDANVGKSPWRADPDENFNYYTYWSKDKKTRVAIYTLATHTLLVTSKPYLQRFGHLGTASQPSKMDGF